MLKRESKEVSDDDFRIWQQCPVIEHKFVPSTADIAESSLDEWMQVYSYYRPEHRGETLGGAMTVTH